MGVMLMTEVKRNGSAVIGFPGLPLCAQSKHIACRPMKPEHHQQVSWRPSRSTCLLEMRTARILFTWGEL